MLTNEKVFQFTSSNAEFVVGSGCCWGTFMPPTVADFGIELKAKKINVKWKFS